MTNQWISKGPSSLAMGLHQRENLVGRSDEFADGIAFGDAAGS